MKRSNSFKGSEPRKQLPDPNAPKVRQGGKGGSVKTRNQFENVNFNNYADGRNSGVSIDFEAGGGGYISTVDNGQVVTPSIDMDSPPPMLKDSPIIHDVQIDMQGGGIIPGGDENVMPKKGGGVLPIDPPPPPKLPQDEIEEILNEEQALTPTVDNKRKKLWLWLLIIIAVLALLYYLNKGKL